MKKIITILLTTALILSSVVAGQTIGKESKAAITTSAKTVKPGEEVNAVQETDEEYYKIMLQNPSKVTLNVSDELSSYTLYTSNRKKEFSCEKTMYLDKGTYYILHTTKGMYRFSYTTKKIYLTGNTSKKKAKTIKLKKKIKGVLTKTTSCWYKIVLSKEQKIKVNFKNPDKNYVSMMFFTTKGKVVTVNYFADKNTTRYIEYFSGNKSSFKVPEGTYYIEVSTTGNGNFSFVMK